MMINHTHLYLAFRRHGKSYTHKGNDLFVEFMSLVMMRAIRDVGYPVIGSNKKLK